MNETIPTSEERNWAMAAHLGQVAAIFLTAGVLSWAVPLVVFLLKREESAFVEEHAKEALNFQITVWLAVLVYSVISALLICLVIGLPMLIVGSIVYVVYVLVFGILAGLAASRGEHYRYPCTLRLIA